MTLDRVTHGASRRRLMHFDRATDRSVAICSATGRRPAGALDDTRRASIRGALAGALPATGCASGSRTRGRRILRRARARGARTVALREKPIEDNAMGADALMRLATLTGDEQWRETATRALRSFVGSYRGWGQFASSYANAIARR
jgi:hypothetical protein